MAKDPASSGVELSTNPLLAAIDPQPFDRRHYVIMIGYIGELTADEVRVYPRLDLRSYFNIPRDAIKSSEKVFADQASSPTKLVIDASVKVELVRIDIRSIEAGFLFGPISEANLGSALEGAAVGVKKHGEVPATGDPCATPKPANGGTFSQCNKPHLCATDPMFDLY